MKQVVNQGILDVVDLILADYEEELKIAARIPIAADST